MKKTLAILMAALMLLGLTACSSAPEATTEPAATAEQTEQTAAPAEEKQSYTVGIPLLTLPHRASRMCSPSSWATA